jgi:hypothetical protein
LCKALSAPLFHCAWFFPFFTVTKKGEAKRCFLCCYGRFLNSSMPTMTIATIMAIVETVKYVSTCACGTGVGGGVVGGSSITVNTVSAKEGQ